MAIRYGLVLAVYACECRTLTINKVLHLDVPNHINEQVRPQTVERGEAAQGLRVHMLEHAAA